MSCQLSSFPILEKKENPFNMLRPHVCLHSNRFVVIFLFAKKNPHINCGVYKKGFHIAYVKAASKEIQVVCLLWLTNV